MIIKGNITDVATMNRNGSGIHTKVVSTTREGKRFSFVVPGEVPQEAIGKRFEYVSMPSRDPEDTIPSSRKSRGIVYSFEIKADFGEYVPNRYCGFVN